MLQRPKVGIGALIFRGSTLLLGRRKNAHGHDSWAPPGGHLECGEDWRTCALRETEEETGLRLTDATFFAATNDIFDEQKHYVTIFMLAEYSGGEVQNLEPEKCFEWQWFDLHELPDNLFLSFEHCMQEHSERLKALISNCPRSS